jgi:hypothetical protein
VDETPGNGNGRAVAFLVGLPLSDCHQQAVLAEFKIVKVEPDKFRAAKCAGKAQQQERAIAKPLGPSSVSAEAGIAGLREIGSSVANLSAAL